MKLIIQIPCWNEASSLPALVPQLPRQLDGFEEMIFAGELRRQLGERVEGGQLPFSGNLELERHFEDDVGSAAVGKPGEFFQVVWGAMIEDFVGALFARELAAFVSPARADDTDAVDFAPLNRRGADAAAGAMDENGFARLGFGFLKKGSVGGGVRNVEAGEKICSCFAVIHCRTADETETSEGNNLAHASSIRDLISWAFVDRLFDRLKTAIHEITRKTSRVLRCISSLVRVYFPKKELLARFAIVHQRRDNRHDT